MIEKMHQLYIGIHGLAGSGKDTVAKMLKVILSKFNESLEDCKTFYKQTYTNPTQSATYNPRPTNKEFEENCPVMCIAYADQLKKICSTIFGIPIERFYMNKENAWLCINKNFTYTEIKPNDSEIITAEQFYYGKSEFANSSQKYWMSLREILVYTGTYVLQEDISRNIFVNIIRNEIKEETNRNSNIGYVIITDNRFKHELDFIREKNGITIKVVRESVEQLPNIAEHILDEEDSFDYVIENNDGYDELFEKIYDMAHNDIEFKNKTVSLLTRDNIDNYLRLIADNTYVLCTSLPIQNVYHTDGKISVINPTGGPMIGLNAPIPGADNLCPSKIIFNDDYNKFLIIV